MTAEVTEKDLGGAKLNSVSATSYGDVFDFCLNIWNILVFTRLIARFLFNHELFIGKLTLAAGIILLILSVCNAMLMYRNKKRRGRESFTSSKESEVEFKV